jgi:Protein of unknown function (DUF2612)
MSTTPPFTPPTLETYLALITSEHNQKPKFMATVAAEIQPFVDLQATLASMIGIFSPNSVGDQLDKVGVWVGASRDLQDPIEGVYFAWDTPGVGWDQGTWFATGDPTTGLLVLPDDGFQSLIKFTIAMNQWDGTVPGAYAIFNSVFASDGISILIQDNQDMTMFIVVMGMLNAVVQALISGGNFNLKPAGVQITNFYQPSVPGAPVFGLGANNASVAGLGVGCWVQPIE